MISAGREFVRTPPRVCAYSSARVLTQLRLVALPHAWWGPRARFKPEMRDLCSSGRLNSASCGRFQIKSALRLLLLVLAASGWSLVLPLACAQPGTPLWTNR